MYAVGTTIPRILLETYGFNKVNEGCYECRENDCFVFTEQVKQDKGLLKILLINQKGMPMRRVGYTANFSSW